MESQFITITILSALITGIVAAIKVMVPDLNKRFVPVLAIGTGLISSLTLLWGQFNWQEIIAIGLTLGLGSIGFYEVGKVTLASGKK